MTVPQHTSAPDKAIFREVQRPRQWWIALIVIVVTLMSWVMFILQIGFGREVGDEPMSDALMVLFWVIFGWLFPAAWIAARLVVEVRPAELYIHYVPFMTRTIPYDAIEAVQAETYQPVREFGGWGIRMWFTRRHMAYSVRGDQGVRLGLRDGRTVVIGSQRPQPLADAIQARLAESSSA